MKQKPSRWQFLLRGLGMISLPLVIVMVMLWKPDYQPPVFDAQIHYNENSWKRVRVDAIANGVRELNIRWLLVGSTPNSGTWRLAEALPDRVIPMWVPELKRGQRDQWANDLEQIQEMVEALGSGRYRGVGELWLAAGDIGSEGVKQLIDVARQQDLILHLRTDPGTIKELYSKAFDLKILWAHAGVYADSKQVDELLWKYPNLWIELSHRRDATQGGELHPNWRTLILNHPDQVLVGSGTYSADYWFQYRTIISNHRKWLSELPAEVAAQVAYLNGERLFNLHRFTASQIEGSR